MIFLELEKLQEESIQAELLSVIENLCEEYQLGDHFGTISTAIHELADLVLEYGRAEMNSYQASFIIDTTEISFQIRQTTNLFSLKKLFSNNNRDERVFTIVNLANEIEFSDDDQDISLSFHVKPNFKPAARREVSEIQQQMLFEETNRNKQ